MTEQITNIITILIGIVGMLGTLLAVLLAYSNYQQYKSEESLEKILVNLSANYSSFDHDSMNFYDRFYNILVELEKYKYIHNNFKYQCEFTKNTRKY